MVSVTVSVSPEIKREMDRYDEINWSAFVRNAIAAKAEELAWREKMLDEIDKNAREEFLERMKEPKVRKEYLEKLARIRKYDRIVTLDDPEEHFLDEPSEAS